jgi:hypothetical protein
MRCLEPLGEHVVRAIQVAEVNVANERPRRERFELLRLQWSAEHGGAPVEGDAMGEEQPRVLPLVPAEFGDLEDEVSLKDLAVRQPTA